MDPAEHEPTPRRRLEHRAIGREQGLEIGYAIVPCSLGRLLVAATARGVCNVRFGDEDPGLEKGLAEEFPFAVLGPGDARVEAWCREVVRYVDGETTRIRVPFDVRASRFQRRVWDALQAIPRGATRSYSEIATSLGMPKGARAVARACATNPIAVVVPCHRVVARDGGLTGYRWGLPRKRALLEREGARLPG
jgi:AraC family transcriptional regulator of adaptative response/methylated-DNA-[protein]-cysteine methyltransferase